QGQVEYDFVVAPGVNPDVVRLRVQDQGGQDLPVDLDAAGGLGGGGGGGEGRAPQPRRSQESEAREEPTRGHSRELAPPRGLSHIGFVVAAYDGSQPLIIDPVVSYATYLGGSSNDSAEGIAVDSLGNAYIVGGTQSSNFPCTVESCDGLGGPGDAFVTKLNPG